MKTKIILFLNFSIFFNCIKGNLISKNCVSSKIISIQFSEPFNYSKLDTLFIDGLKYTHSYSMNSINNNDKLPKEKVVLFEKDGKEATTKTNIISIARIFAFKLKSTGTYEIINIPEVITTGVIRFKRIDEKKINICTTKNYLAKLEAL
ncbi:hypothetical protein N8480_06080 [Flavobacteriaceae bacterium]|nr:hypothetical protein [Flavobacteriaceae bacterium]